MAAVNIAFEVPQAPTFNIEKFRQQVIDYANSLIASLTIKPQEKKKGHQILQYNDLSPEIQGLIGICKGAVTEEDLDGDSERNEALIQKYGTA